MTKGQKIRLVIDTLLATLKLYMTDKEITEYKSGKTPLIKYGVCTGITYLIDEELQKIDNKVCILSIDTMVSFIKDLKRDL